MFTDTLQAQRADRPAGPVRPRPRSDGGTSRPETDETVALTVDEADHGTARITASSALGLAVELRALRDRLRERRRSLTVRFDAADVALVAVALERRAGATPAAGVCADLRTRAGWLTDRLRTCTPALAGWVESHAPEP